MLVPLVIPWCEIAGLMTDDYDDYELATSGLRTSYCDLLLCSEIQFVRQLVEICFTY